MAWPPVQEPWELHPELAKARDHVQVGGFVQTSFTAAMCNAVFSSGMAVIIVGTVPGTSGDPSQRTSTSNRMAPAAAPAQCSTGDATPV